MARVGAVLSLIILTALVLTTGCLDSSGPSDSLPKAASLPGLVVSAPVPLSGSGTENGKLPAASPVSVSLVYVSMSPGSVPNGLQVTIGDQATGTLVTTGVVDGGFDPVAVRANVGDTLVVEITRNGSVSPIRAVLLVTVKRPPAVVRTSPPPQKVDVPLNSIIVVVFSTPIDSSSLTPGSIQLWRDTTPVPGAVRRTDATGLRAAFYSDNLLASQTAYRLVVTQTVRDVSGNVLASPAEADFTTGTTVQATTKLAFLVGPGTVGVGQPFTVQVVTEDSLGGWVRSLADSPTVILSLDANLAGATLAGTLTAPAINGIASFENLSLDRAGVGYTLAATSGPLVGATSPPFTVLGTSGGAGLVFGSVSAGTFHTCGVTIEGKAYCWGYNAESQLGSGTTVSSTTPVPVAGGLTFASVSAGYISTCGVTTAGAAYCWGDESLGADSVTYANGGCMGGSGCPTPLPVAGGHTFAMVSVGDYHTCGVTTDGAAYCWGQGLEGELGAGFTGSGPGSTEAATPVAVAGGHSFATVGAGYHHTCGLTTDGAAYCWGDNVFAELGTGTSGGLQCGSGGDTTCSFIPVAVAGGLTFGQISVGEGFTCGVVTTGAAYCWGDNSYGNLGTGRTTGPEVCVYSVYGDSSPCSTSPVPVNGGLSFNMMNVRYATCGLTTTGAAYCWNAPGNPGTASLVPRSVAEGLTFATASTSLRQMCGVTSGGVAYCWGGNPNGELGNGTTTNSSMPVKVAGQP